MSTHWQQLAAMWRDAGLKIRPSVNSAAIRDFEIKHDVVLPADLRDYFLTVDGMEDDLDPGMNRFWPLAMVKLVNEELKDIHPDRWAYPDCYIFADHCLWCLAWAIRLGKKQLEISEPVFQVTGAEVPGRMIAPSFSDFVQMYLGNPDSVL